MDTNHDDQLIEALSADAAQLKERAEERVSFRRVTAVFSCFTPPRQLATPGGDARYSAVAGPAWLGCRSGPGPAASRSRTAR